MSEEPSVIIVIPTYNERENVESLLPAVLEILPEAHILIVDDKSPDGTGQIAEECADKDPAHISVLSRKKKEGLGAAYIAGYKHALLQWPNASLFVQMDADFSHDPKYLPQMIKAADAADVVVASRYVSGISIVNWPLHRLIVSKLGTTFARTVTGMPLTDCTSGFKCYHRHVLENIGLEQIRSNGYVFQVETSFRAWQKGYKLLDFPIIFYERRQGSSKLSLAIAFEAFRVVLRLGLERLVTKNLG